MRKCVYGLFLCGLVVSGGMSAATGNLSAFFPQAEERVKEIPNPEKAARKLTDEMDELLQLTEKQYKKIYKLNLKEEKEKIERMTGNATDGRDASSGWFPSDERDASSDAGKHAGGYARPDREAE